MSHLTCKFIPAILATCALAFSLSPTFATISPNTDFHPPIKLNQISHPKAAPSIADIDNDGRLDLIVGEFRRGPYQSSPVHFYRNIGTFQKPRFAKPTLLRTSNSIVQTPSFCNSGSSAQFIDFTGNGKKDLICTATHRTNFAGQIQLYPHSQNAQFSPPSTFIYTQSKYPQKQFGYNRYVHVADWNSDGRLDLIIGARSRILFLQNIGSTKLPKYAPPIEITADNKTLNKPGMAPHIADWNSDGRLDLIIGKSDGSVTWCKNLAAKGKPKLGPEQTILPPVSNTTFKRKRHEPRLAGTSRGRHAQIAIADLNADGKPDLIVGDLQREVVTRPPLTPAEQNAEGQAKILYKVARNHVYALQSDIKKLPSNQHAHKLQLQQQLHTATLEAKAAYQNLIQFKISQYAQHGSVWLYLRK